MGLAAGKDEQHAGPKHFGSSMSREILRKKGTCLRNIYILILTVLLLALSCICTGSVFKDSELSCFDVCLEPGENSDLARSDSTLLCYSLVSSQSDQEVRNKLSDADKKSCSRYSYPAKS